MGWLRFRYTDDGIVGIFDNGKEVIFDKEDLELVSSRKWYIDETGYARSHKCERMHRVLLESELDDGLVVDHINRDKLDNRRKNLRICTQQTNVQNAGMKNTNKSGVTGVFLDKKVHRWRAQISVQGNGKPDELHIIMGDYRDADSILRKSLPINFCPICGRRLREEKENV